MRPPRRPREQGFTLVELVITVVLIGLMAAFGSNMFSDVFRTVHIVQASQTSADQARYALERIARELREVKFVSGTGYNVTSSLTAGASTISFTNASNTAVTISAGSGTLTLTRAGVNAALATNVSGFSLDFLALDNSATASLSTLRFVVVTLSLTDATSGQSVTQRTRVALRNA